ncbi:MAG: 2-C-methyl-D-erythritol 2,4-cyclodiphosphate synthase [Mogibacterium sp.]|nr:2-C-methyl-D-erythritol 2,4-cyclodiphosphate synthase [Mogibacterium sp.]
MEHEHIYSIIVAAGKGTRMGLDIPKQLMPYEGDTVLGTTIRRFAMSGLVLGIIVVSPQDGSLDDVYEAMAEKISRECGCAAKITVTRGGAERGDSVKAGLAAVRDLSSSEGADPSDVLVLIHDAARPGVTEDIIARNIRAMQNCRAVTTAIPSIDSIRFIPIQNYENKAIIQSFSLKESITYPIMNSNVVERERVYCVQTPQTFRLQDIMAAYDKADADGYRGTDDASIAEYAGMDVAIVMGDPANSKITYQEDISMTTRVGTGYDVHRLVPGRDLILCGTPVPYERGLLGHSDADVATHALMDALLGAAGLGDIGRHFPDNDDKYKGADSLGLLAEVKKMLGDARINNVDITIIAQAPKLSPYNKQMQSNISRTLGIPESSVNIKATTEEGLGFTGSGEGIAAIATCAIEGRFI